jgi:peptide/nickel transport system ATP-binding protein
MLVMAGHSRLKDGVASARLCIAIHVFVSQETSQDVDHRDKPGDDSSYVEAGWIASLRSQ